MRLPTTTGGHHVNDTDCNPEFVYRSPQLTAERLRHAEFMRQHWYDALDRLRRQHAEMAAVCERLVRLEGGCGGATCNIGGGLCSECCARRMTLLARIRELLGVS